MFTEKVYMTLENLMNKKVDKNLIEKLIGASDEGYSYLINSMLKDICTSDLKSKTISMLEKLKSIKESKIEIGKDETLGYWLSYEIVESKYEDLPLDYFNKLDIKFQEDKEISVEYIQDSIEHMSQGIYNRMQILDTLIYSHDKNNIKVVKPIKRKFLNSELFIGLNNISSLITELSKKSKSNDVNDLKSDIKKALTLLSDSKELGKELILCFNDVEKRVEGGKAYLNLPMFGKRVTLLLEPKNMRFVTDTFRLIRADGIYTNPITDNNITVWIIWRIKKNA